VRVRVRVRVRVICIMKICMMLLTALTAVLLQPVAYIDVA
jgi:hypothetical protein